MPQNQQSALEPKVQFLSGVTLSDRVSNYNAPNTPCSEGTLVKVASDGATFELCGNNNAQFILEQACDAYGALGSAANREKYLQGIPQRTVKTSTPITAYPLKSGMIIWTTVIATGTETGALRPETVTPGTTEVEAYNGKFRALQAGNDPIGVCVSDVDDRGGVKILIY
ncbi:MAG: hypothetical protein QXU75_06475 [Candidatus Methanomethylicaceae archaeon]